MARFFSSLGVSAFVTFMLIALGYLAYFVGKWLFAWLLYGIAVGYGGYFIAVLALFSVVFIFAFKSYPDDDN